MDWNDQEFNGVVFPPDGTVAPFTVINMGHGMVEISKALHNGLPALWFGRLDAPIPIGDVVQEEPGRMALPGQGLACVTFSNVASLEVVLEKLQEIRAAMLQQAGE